MRRLAFELDCATANDRDTLRELWGYYVDEQELERVLSPTRTSPTVEEVSFFVEGEPEAAAHVQPSGQSEAPHKRKLDELSTWDQGLDEWTKQLRCDERITRSWFRQNK